jgi:hypothetical protein
MLTVKENVISIFVILIVIMAREYYNESIWLVFKSSHEVP